MPKTAKPDGSAAGTSTKAANEAKDLISNATSPPLKADDAGKAGKTQHAWLWFASKDLKLKNVGSVARDHLANERTFLAWLRTSLALASVGVAISQLFRLSASVYTLSDLPDVPTATTTSATVTEEQLISAISSLSTIVQRQTEQLRSLGSSVDSERSRYYTLGRPVGGTFVLMGLAFMLLGGFRYLSVQHYLTTQDMFPPARRSVLIASFLIAALVTATFASVLVIRPRTNRVGNPVNLLKGNTVDWDLVAACLYCCYQVHRCGNCCSCTAEDQKQSLEEELSYRPCKAPQQARFGFNDPTSFTRACSYSPQCCSWGTLFSCPLLCSWCSSSWMEQIPHRTFSSLSVLAEMRARAHVIRECALGVTTARRDVSVGCSPP